MEYTLLPDHEAIREQFCRRFTLPYGAFVRAHSQWLASLPMRFRREYTQSFHERRLLSDRLRPEFEELSFADALAALRQIDGPVRLLTNGPDSAMRDYRTLGNHTACVAETDPQELADTLEYEWFEEYRLNEQMMYLADAILPSEVYVFDEAMDRCIIFTHETDETELPETRVCLIFRP